MPTVSVVIPNYNYARFLDQRIQSVLKQTFQDFEIIYLDDASTDNSEEVIKKYQNDSRVRCIYNSVNSGNVFKQWNKGVKEARGRYIWIAEADDFVDERFLERLIPRLEANPRVGVAYCQSMRVDESGASLGTMQWWTRDLDEWRWNRDFQNSGREECRRFLSMKNTIPNASAVVFRRDVYQRSGGADESMTACGDWMCWAKCLLNSDLCFVAEPLNYFRQHRGSVRSRHAENGVLSLESYRVLDFIHTQCGVEAPQLRRACEQMRSNWLDIGLRRRSRVPLRRNWQIYLVARRVDRQLHLQLLRVVIGHARRIWRRFGAKNRA